MVRVQSPNVSLSIRKYLGVKDAPDKVDILSAVLPVLAYPIYEYKYFTKTVTCGADGNWTIATVPNDEDWLWVGFSITRSAGNGHIDYVYFNVPASEVAGAATPTSSIDTYVHDEITTFPEVHHFGAYVPLCSGALVRITEDFNAVADTYVFVGWFLQRKW